MEELNEIEKELIELKDKERKRRIKKAIRKS